MYVGHTVAEKGTDLSEAVDPLARGLRRFATYPGAKDVVLEYVGPSSFRTALGRRIQHLPD